MPNITLSISDLVFTRCEGEFVARSNSNSLTLNDYQNDESNLLECHWIIFQEYTSYPEPFPTEHNAIQLQFNDIFFLEVGHLEVGYEYLLIIIKMRIRRRMPSSLFCLNGRVFLPVNYGRPLFFSVLSICFCLGHHCHQGKEGILPFSR